MFMPQQTIGRVPCCICGVAMEPNPANMCVRCIRSSVDITEGLQKHVTIVHCPECNSYLQPPRTWIKAELESKELLTFCIKRLKNMNKIRLVHAEFVWTEPHSKRIKVKLRIQKEAINGAIVEQAYVVEYTQQEHMCDSCTRTQANPDQWVAVVQVRQHVSHRRTFFYLEQLILKHGAAVRATNIKEMDYGIDFFFGNRSHALKFVEFLGSVVPTRKREDKQLVSHDPKSNKFNNRYTFSVEICKICREDLICLPPKVAASLGNLGPIVLCTKVSDSLLLIDPQTLRSAYMDASQYWRNPFKALMNSRQLVEYQVLDTEVDHSEVKIGATKYALAYVELARVSDFGNNDKRMIVRTHLGHQLQVGHRALGYDLFAANNNDDEIDKYKRLDLPEAILVKRSHERERQRRHGKPRAWKLKNLDMDVANPKGRVEEENRNKEYEDFIHDLETDPELRFNVSLYRNRDDDDDDADDASIPVDLLADLCLDDEDDEIDHTMEE